MATTENARFDRLVETFRNDGLQTSPEEVRFLYRHLPDVPLETLIDGCRREDRQRWLRDARIITRGKLYRILQRARHLGLNPSYRQLRQGGIHLDKLLRSPLHEFRERIQRIVDTFENPSAPADEAGAFFMLKYNYEIDSRFLSKTNIDSRQKSSW